MGTLSYTPYEGLNLTYHKYRKLGGFDRKLGGIYAPFIVILITILEN